MKELVLNTLFIIGMFNLVVCGNSLLSHTIKKYINHYLLPNNLDTYINIITGVILIIIYLLCTN